MAVEKVANRVERVCGRNRNKVRKKRIKCGCDVVWWGKRYRKSIKGRRCCLDKRGRRGRSRV